MKTPPFLRVTGLLLLLALAYAVHATWPAQPDPIERYVAWPAPMADAFEVQRKRPDSKPDDARGRMSFELARLRDPQTGRLPENIRRRELAFAARLPEQDAMSKNSLYAADWSPRGPHNLGGRTRALAIDLDYNGASNRRILAGGVSGGMFLSEDDGATWQFTSSLSTLASVTALAQDPNNRQVWYHGTGEFVGGSAGPFGSHLGQGLFKSTDGGRTWSQLPGSFGNNRPNVFDDPLDYVWNVKVHPQGSVVLVASVGGISRSTDGGQTWTLTLGALQNPLSLMSDVAIASNGHVYATLSKNGANVAQHGVFRSTDQGRTWTPISPPGLSADPWRMVLATAPSDANTVYLLVQANQQGAKSADHQLFKYNAGANSWTNLSATLPVVTQPGPQGQQPIPDIAEFNSQGGYDLVVAVKPDNPNIVWIGGTNLYRSTNGGTSWEQVGGYESAYRVALYANQHPDQHVMVFYPGNPNAMISGHDGGLSRTTNALQSPQQWTFINEGYVSSQWYAIAQDPSGGNDLLVGGTQDNGTWLTTQAGATDPWVERFGGDGAFAAVAPGASALYVSSQNANVIRIRPVNNQLSYSLVSPTNLQNPLFIAPFQLDPNDARVMYLAGGNTVWRNSNLDGIQEGNFNPTAQNWTQLTGSAVGTINTHQVTALTVAKSPANRLYFGATDYQNDTRLVRLDNPQGNGAGVAITPPVEAGSYPSGIAVHPSNGDEVMAVFSNYNVKSVWHSTNGGQTWTDVEGNLGGEDGPSVRWAVIHPTAGGLVYLLATSTGVYSTTTLAGAATSWVHEGGSVIGNVPTNMIVARDDGTVIAATHGRGVYSARLTSGGGGQAQASLSVGQVSLGVLPGTQGQASVTLRNLGGAPLQFTAQAACDVSGKTGETQQVTTLLSGPPRRLTLSGAPVPRAAVSVRNPAAGLQKAPMNRPGTVLTLDDGNDAPDDFIGNPNNVFSWFNQFDVTGTPFTLEEIRWYMRTEGSFNNFATVTLYDSTGTELASGALTPGLSPNGRWYSVTMQNPITFNPGSFFFVEVSGPFDVSFPAGADRQGQVPGKSYYFNAFSFQNVPLSTISGFANGAFLIRASGTQQQAQNVPPVAVARVSTNAPQVGETVSFDASGSTDSDGQVVGYLWQFGDGRSSNQAVTTHAYTQPGTYTLSLTVTDDDGATGSVSGQLTVTGGGGGGCPLTVTPASGSIAAGAARELVVSYDARDVAVGTYTGRLNIGGNGGSVSVPVSITVSPTVSTTPGEAQVVTALHAVRPNPFVEAVEISYTLATPGHTRLAVYDILGRRVVLLHEGGHIAGPHTARWDGRDGAGQDVANGIYFVRLETADVPGGAITRRIVKAR